MSGAEPPLALAIVGALLGPVIEVGKLAYKPMKRKYYYLCRLSSNIKNLHAEAEKLDDAKRALQIQVDRARDNTDTILPQVETWLRDYDDIKYTVSLLTNLAPTLESDHSKVAARYRLSKAAMKLTDRIKLQLEEMSKFSSTVSLPAPPAATEAVAIGGTTYDFESRKQIEEDIMWSLRGMDFNTIGICGMGGVGKTTMAKRIMNRALDEGVFDEVVMIVVTQQVDNVKIQVEIAGSLGLRLDGETTSQTRVQRLRARLMGTRRRRVLLVLDDVWKRLELEELGIPCRNGARGCTVVLTSRNMDVLRAMNVGKICGLQTLSEPESWFLFRENAGRVVDDVVINPIAKHVVRECKGLPIALAAVGVALKDENGKSIWEDALRQLRKSNPSDIPNIITDVYNPMKLSYDFLENEHARSIFLLCCLFAEDDDIPLENLTYLCMGMRLFEGIWEFEEMRGRICSLIKLLKTRFLLLDGSDEDHVRMHDVVRDVAIFIASKERYVKCKDCTWISSFVVDHERARSIDDEFGFPKLKLLLIDNKVGNEIQIDYNRFIGGAKDLNVVFIRHGLVKSLPHTSQLLKSLTTLVLYNCESLESVSAVGKFESLEILICHCLDQVKELPIQMRGLRRLRLLEISECVRLKHVAPGVISSLVGLEELKMVKSFGGWEGDHGKERKNAALKELESLANLRCLEIKVLDHALAALPLCLSPNLVKFDIQFGTNPRYDGFKPVKKSYAKNLCFEFSVEKSVLGDLSNNFFLASTEYLVAKGPFPYTHLNLAKAQNTRWLDLDGFGSVSWSFAAFPILESIYLHGLVKLEEIWDGPIPPKSFNNLRKLSLQSLPALKQLGKNPYHNSVVPLYTNLSSINVTGCKRLGYLFSSPTTNDCLLQLEALYISFCDEMEHVVLLQNDSTMRQESDRITISLPKLKSLSLRDNPKLKSIFKGIQRIGFPLLEEMQVGDCRDMISFVPNDDDDEDDLDYDSTHLFCQPKVSFGNLKRLYVWQIESKKAWCDQVPMSFFNGLEQLSINSYRKIRSLFSSSIAQNLVNLQKLDISYCQEMVNVIEDTSDDDVRTKHSLVLFPMLQEIQVSYLSKLESFCEWRSSSSGVVELHSLKILRVDHCFQMKSFSAGSLITPAMKTVTINGKELECVEDLNGALHQHFQKAKKEMMME